jgi:cystathionine beta-lyase/cystathionine gamma-synthase
MIAVDYKGSVSDLDRGLKKLKLFALAPSLGGVESLITRPATTSHSGIPLKVRESLGVTDTLVRISIGLENPEDLVADLFENL